jgi:iron complex transport system substrate-binding protein
MLRLSLIACLLLTLVACTTAPTATVSPSAAPVPAATQATAPNKQATRVVALTSLSADILHRLDKSKLVGISGSRLLGKNPDLAQLPHVSEGRTPPNLEKIVALKPDLVIGAAGFHDQVLEKLKGLGIATLTTQVDSWRSLEDLTKTLATRINTNPEVLLKSYQAMRDFKATRTPTTLVLVSDQPIQAPNKTSWAGDFLSQLQAKNVVADLQTASPLKGYVTLSAEKILETNPEVLIVVNAEENTLEKYKAAPFWSQLRAVQTNQVYVFDYYGLVNPGSIGAIASASDQLKQVLAK